MGWPLAVSAALMERRAGALPPALFALAAGHFVSMTMILLPFSLHDRAGALASARSASAPR